MFSSRLCFREDKRGQFQSFENQWFKCTSLQVFPASDVMKILTLVFVSSVPTTPRYKNTEKEISYLHHFAVSYQLSKQN